jgi:hypothetical protein
MLAFLDVVMSANVELGLEDDLVALCCFPVNHIVSVTPTLSSYTHLSIGPQLRRRDL